MIVEMAGRPVAHLTESLEKHVGILKQIKDVTVHEIKISEPKEIELSDENKKKDGQKMFTAFAECDIEMPSFARLSETMFDFMPSSIEVIEPSSIELSTNEATNLLNNISGRMHRYDNIAKVANERLRRMDAQMKVMHTALVNGGKVIPKVKENIDSLKRKKTKSSSNKKK